MNTVFGIAIVGISIVLILVIIWPVIVAIGFALSKEKSDE